MRPFSIFTQLAVVTAAGVLAIGWSGSTYADPPESFMGGGDVDDLSFNGEVARDASVKSGWSIKVTFENRGDADQTCNLDTELTRAQVSPASRASPPGVAVWHRKDKIAVPAHETAERTYEVPQWMAAQLTANEKSVELRQKAVEKESEKPNPNYALSMRPYTSYSVAFRKADG
jgi:hypothetical protein